MLDVNKIKTTEELLQNAKWLEGKTLAEITEKIQSQDKTSRVLTKGSVGYVIEEGYFGIKKNSASQPDIVHLGVEVKTCPLEYNKKRTKLTVKEPLSLGIINYTNEAKNTNIRQSSLAKKNKKILFVCYIHDKEKDRSEYLIKKVFLWTMTESILDELNTDYLKLVEMINAGKAHEIHQYQHKALTLCPKHNGTFNDPTCNKSKTKQPFSSIPAEIRAFRLKNSFMKKILPEGTLIP